MQEQQRLKKEAEDKPAAEEAERERIEREKAAAAARKKRKTIMAIAVILAIAAIAGALLYTKVLLPKQKYDRAMELLSSGKYDEAYVLLGEIGELEAIKQSEFDRAEKMISSGDYKGAYQLFSSMDDKDSAERADKLLQEHWGEFNMNAAPGDVVVFGSYEQDNNTANGAEAIEWQVLTRENDRLLVISKYALDCQRYTLDWQPYNTKRTDVTWETCSLRKWLNDTFLNASFSVEEQAMIPTVTVSADKNPDYSTSPGSSTKDQIFLLSIPEVRRYFGSDEARKCVLTAYAIARGAYTNDTYSVSGKATCQWWLRSPGDIDFYAANVFNDGSVDSSGRNVCQDNVAVRPVLWIDLGS